jgi:hypothetical protein
MRRSEVSKSPHISVHNTRTAPPALAMTNNSKLFVLSPFSFLGKPPGRAFPVFRTYKYLLGLILISLCSSPVVYYTPTFIAPAL